MSRLALLKDKAPNEVIDYTFEWADRIGVDTISSSLVTYTGVDNSLTISGTSNGADDVTFFISGGTMGETYRVKNTIVTTGARTYEQTALLRISVR